MGETRRLGVQVKKVGGGRPLEPGIGKRKPGVLQGRGGGLGTGGAGEGRGSHPALAGWKKPGACTTTPGGAERAPRPGPSGRGRAPHSGYGAERR